MKDYRVRFVLIVRTLLLDPVRRGSRQERTGYQRISIHVAHNISIDLSPCFS